MVSKASLRNTTGAVIDNQTGQSLDEELTQSQQRISGLEQQNEHLKQQLTEMQDTLDRANIKIHLLEERVASLNKEVIEVSTSGTKVNISYQQLLAQTQGAQS